MPCSNIRVKVPKLIVRDVFRNISRYSCAKKYHESRAQILYPTDREARTFTIGVQTHPTFKSREAKLFQQKIFPQISESFIIYHGMWKFVKILNNSGKVSTERRTFFPNICCIIFMKQLGNIRGRRNIPPAFTTVYEEEFILDFSVAVLSMYSITLL